MPKVHLEFSIKLFRYLTASEVFCALTKLHFPALICGAAKVCFRAEIEAPGGSWSEGTAFAALQISQGGCGFAFKNLKRSV
jgi:hypothetical protein